MSQLPYINETHKQEHEHEARSKRSLMIGYDSDTLSYNKLKVNSDGSLGEALPTSGNNPSLVLGYTDGNLTSISKTIGTTTYQKTLSYTDDKLTSVSSWS